MVNSSPWRALSRSLLSFSLGQDLLNLFHKSWTASECHLRVVHAVVLRECRSIQVGQYYHATTDAAPIAKVEWHPWGEAGSTLMVMTTDGKLRFVELFLVIVNPALLMPILFLGSMTFLRIRRNHSRSSPSYSHGRRRKASHTASSMNQNTKSLLSRSARDWQTGVL